MFDLDERDTYTYEPPTQPLPIANTGPSRLSLAPRNIYSQQDREPRAITNADHHFKFGQNLRHGMPMNQPQPVANNVPAQSPLSKLATNMLLQDRMLEGNKDPPNFFHGMHQDKFNQLQPPKQQITPPFNLSKFAKSLLDMPNLTSLGGYVYSPNVKQALAVSSPPDVQNSSPTARISLRRATSRTTPQTQYTEKDPHVVEYSNPPETLQRQISFPTNKPNRATPQTLALGYAPPMAHGIQLVSPHELPDRFRHVFPYELFNAVQSRCFSPIYRSSDNVVVSAPTGR
jgi:ATP-dependent DNA helicase HFM1/MER3